MSEAKPVAGCGWGGVEGRRGPEQGQEERKRKRKTEIYYLRKYNNSSSNFPSTDRALITLTAIVLEDGSEELFCYSCTCPFGLRSFLWPDSIPNRQ